MPVFIPKEIELSKFKHVYRLNLEKSIDNVFFTLEKFPIIYLNSSFIYIKQNGNKELVQETVCDAAIDKYGLQYTLENLLDTHFNNRLNMNFYPFRQYPLRRYFVDNTLSVEMMKKIISMYNQNIKQYLEREENNEEIGIEEEKEKREKDIQNLIKRYKNNRKKYKYLGKFLLT